MEHSVGHLAAEAGAPCAAAVPVFVSTDVVLLEANHGLCALTISTGATQFFPAHGSGVACLTACASQNLFAYAERCFRPAILVVSFPQNQMLHRLNHPSGDLLAYDALALHALGTVLISVTSEPILELIVWDLASHAPLVTSTRPTVGPRSSFHLVFAPSTDLVRFCLISAEEVSLWSVETCDSLSVLLEQPLVLSDPIAPPPDTLESLLLSIRHGTRPIPLSCCWFTSKDIFIATASGQLFQVDATTCTASLIKTVEGAVFLTAQQDLLVQADATGRIAWCSVFEGKITVVREKMVGEPIRFISALPGCDYLVVAGASTLQVIRPKEHKRRMQFHHRAVVGLGILEAPVGTSYATVDAAGLLLVRQENGALLCRLDLPFTPTTMQTRPSTCQLLIGSTDGSIYAASFDGETLTLNRRVQLCSAAISHMTVDSAGRYCLSVDVVGRLSVCTLAAGPELVGFLPPVLEMVVTSLAATAFPDGLVKFALALRNSSGATGGSLVTGVLAGDSRASCQSVEYAAAEVQLQQAVLKETPAAVCITCESLLAVFCEQRDSIAIYDWNISTRELLAFYVFPRGTVGPCHAISSSGGLLVTSVSKEGTLAVRLATGFPDCWEAPAMSATTLPKRGKVVPPLLAVSVDSSQIAMVLADGSFNVFGWHFAMADVFKQTRELGNRLCSLGVANHTAAKKMAGVVSHANPETNSEINSPIPAAKKLTTARASAQNDAATLRSKVQQLREQVLALIDANSIKPDLERLDSEEYTLDMVKQQELTEQGTVELNALREQIELEILAQKYQRMLVKQECWDSMEVVGRSLYAFDQALEVANYPLRKRSIAELADLARVQAARRLELAESHARQTAYGLALSAERAGDSDGSADRSGAEPVLYDPMTLSSSVRKRNQVVLLRDRIQCLKLQFNAEFTDSLQAKEDDIKKMAARNERIGKIGTELGQTVDMYKPCKHQLEQPESLLEVSEEEITVAKVLSAADRVADEEAVCAEAMRIAQGARDNPRERGVLDMMGGRLQDSAEEDVWLDLPRPAFLDELNREEWSDAHKAEAEQYAKEAKALEEKRTVRRKTLEFELAKLYEMNAATRAAFDQRLENLFNRRICTELRIYTEELKMLLLLRMLQQDADWAAAVRKCQQQLELLHTQLQGLGLCKQEAQAAVDEANKELEAVLAADRKLDKEFRHRKEFVDSPFIDVLYRLYRRRPKVISAKPHRMSAGTGELDKEIDCPEGLDDQLWDRMVQLRAERLESEGVTRAKTAHVQQRSAFLQRIIDQEGFLLAARGKLTEQQAWLMHQRNRSHVDYPVVIELKQGLVEVQHERDFDPDFSHCALVDRARIESLNASVRTLGSAKVEFLTQLMELRKGIHRLQWEHRRLDMEKEDLIKKTKDIQLLRVTKNTMAEAGVKEEDRHHREVDTLERTLHVMQTAHERQVEDKKKQLRALKKKLQQKLHGVDQLEARLDEVAHAVSARESVHKIHQAAMAGTTGELFRSRASQRGLLEIVRVQAEELASLRQELERLRMRSFPAFPAKHTTLF